MNQFICEINRNSIAMIKNMLYYSLLLCMLMISGCVYHNEQDLYGACNTPGTVSYSQHVVPLIATNCLSCHSEAEKQGGVILEGHSKIKTWADNGALEGAINHLNGYEPMPKDADKLPECSLELINQWISDGAPNN